MDKLKVLMLTSWYPEEGNPYGGIFIREQAEALSSVCELTLVHVTIDYYTFGPFFSYSLETDEKGGFKVMRLRVSRSFPVYNQFNFFAAAVWQLYKRFKKESFDLIHCQVSYPAGVVGMYVSRLLKIPFIITEHYGGFTGLFRSKIHRAFIIKSMRRAAAVATVSRASARIIGEHVKRKIEITPNMVDVAQFRILPREQDGKKSVAGFLGGLNTDVKGLDILLEAVAKLKNPGLFLRIGGGGVLLDSYKAQAKALGIEKQCLFLGDLHPDDRRAFYDEIDFFVLPSRRESFGIVLLEALASGKPVVATRCGGPEDIVTEENGILVEAGDPDALAEGVRDMLAQRPSFKAQTLRNSVDLKFGKPVFINRLQSLYKKVMQREHA